MTVSRGRLLVGGDIVSVARLHLRRAAPSGCSSPRRTAVQGRRSGEPDKARPTLDQDARYSWIRLLHVSAQMAIVTGPIAVGGFVNTTPRPVSLSYSPCTSSTSNAVAGIP